MISSALVENIKYSSLNFSSDDAENEGGASKKKSSGIFTIFILLVLNGILFYYNFYYEEEEIEYSNFSCTNSYHNNNLKADVMTTNKYNLENGRIVSYDISMVYKFEDRELYDSFVRDGLVYIYMPGDLEDYTNNDVELSYTFLAKHTYDGTLTKDDFIFNAESDGYTCN